MLEQPARGSSQDLCSYFDSAPLNRRYWVSVALLGAMSALEYFDFYVVGFLVAVIGPQWKLTYGQSAIMLLSAGVGSILGALLWGGLSDARGRKMPLLLGTAICGLSALAIAFIFEGQWILFALSRFGVGLGLAAAITPTIALIVECTPTRYRTLIGSLTVVFATMGPLIASLTVAGLLSAIGWRGVAALGVAPAILGIVIALVVPESVRWLVSKGRIDEARKIVASTLDEPLSAVPTTAAVPFVPSQVGFAEVYGQKRAFWLTVAIWLGASTANYGVYLWGPTIVAILLSIGVKEAAGYFVYVALAGLLGKILFSFVPQRVGRKRTGELTGYGMAVALTLVALFHAQFLAGVPLFIVLLVIGALFFDGVFANLAPYSAEIFPVRLAARGVGLAQAANGIGKIAGPLVLTIIAGSDNLVAPKATAEAVLPAFLFLAGCGLLVGLAFTFLGVETHGKPLVVAEPAEDAKARSA